MSIEAIDRIRDVEREADEIIRNAHDEAKARVEAAEAAANLARRQAAEKARIEAVKITGASAARIKIEADKAQKLIEARVSEVNSTAKTNWGKALELAVRKVLSSFGDL
jgi:vacuolar-type H+-ATPase subunit H